MGATRSILFELGQKGGASTTDPLLEGGVREFQDMDYSIQPLNRTLRSSKVIRARWVKNSSGGALSKSTIVKWASGYVKRRVGVVTGSTEVGCGVVDPFLTTTVADGEYFWLIEAGQVPGLSAGSVTANVQVIPTTGGKFTTITADNAGTLAMCGRLVTAATGADQYRDVEFDFTRCP